MGAGSHVTGSWFEPCPVCGEPVLFVRAKPKNTKSDQEPVGKIIRFVCDQCGNDGTAGGNR
jgi:hypothetical protein